MPADHLTAPQRARRKALDRKVKATQRELRQKRFLDLLSSGLTIAAACKQMPMSRGTYENWRREEPTFRAKADEIRLGTVDHDVIEYQGDFVSFRKKFMHFDTYFHQLEIIRAIEAAKPLEVVLILVAPETGKTTVLEDYICWKLGQNPDYLITYISEGMKHVRKVCRKIKGRMTDSVNFKEFIDRFGPFYVQGQEKSGKSWTSEYFSVYKSGEADARDFSFAGGGWRSTIAGTRTDLLLVDDIQSRRSLNSTAEIVDVFRQDHLSRPGRTGKIVIVGTRVEQGDFYERIQEEGIVDRVVSLPMVDHEGRSLCPELWPEDALAQKRKLVGEPAWWRNYMQSPRAAMDATFDDEALTAACREHLAVGSRLADPSTIAGLDPAIAGGNALVIADFNATELQLLDVHYDFNIARTEAILARVQDFAERYGFHELVVETNAFQKSFSNDDRLADLGRRFGFKVIPHETGNNKNDEDLGVARMPRSFRAGEISIPFGDDLARTRFQPLVEQLRNWRPDIPARRRRQDLVMALWFIWLQWDRRRGQLANPAPPIIRRHMPYQPTSMRSIARARR